MPTTNSKLSRGVWAAVGTPFRSGGHIDHDVFAENCRRLAAAKVDGIYATDSDGEFYALELEEFGKLAMTLGRVARELRMPVQMGVTWINTHGVIERIRASIDAGIPTVHLGLPFFMPLADGDVDRFFGDVASAAPSSRWIYYAHPSGQPMLKGRELAQLAANYPDQLVGTKIAAHEMNDLTDVLSNTPQLAHYGGERNLLIAGLLGARGCCSYWVNVMPEWTRKFVRACLDGEPAAAAMHMKFHLWETNHISELRKRGFRHAIIGKARAALSGFLAGDGSTRLPYQSVPSSLIANLQKQFREYWADELALENG